MDVREFRELMNTTLEKMVCFFHLLLSGKLTEFGRLEFCNSRRAVRHVEVCHGRPINGKQFHLLVSTEGSALSEKLLDHWSCVDVPTCSNRITQRRRKIESLARENSIERRENKNYISTINCSARLAFHAT